jgi:PhnB protein
MSQESNDPAERVEFSQDHAEATGMVLRPGKGREVVVGPEQGWAPGQENEEYPTAQAIFMFAVKDAGEALKFYEEAFGAKRQLVVTHPSGRIVHVEFMVNGVLMMASNEIESIGLKYPRALGGFSCCGMFKVDNIDESVKRAERAGARVTMVPTTAYDFLRRGRVEDPYGHVWQLAEQTRRFTRKELLEAAASQAANVGYDVWT